MRAGIRIFIVMALTALLGAGLVATDVLAGKVKKKPTTVVVTDSKLVGNDKRVNAGGTLATVNRCKPNRAMTLYRSDAAGAITSPPLDTKSSLSTGGWQLNGDVPSGVLPTDRFVVTAAKRTIKTKKGKIVCKRGTSAPFPPTFP
jgi:hypothetical protein